MGNNTDYIIEGDSFDTEKKHVEEFQADFQVIVNGIINSYKLMLIKEYDVFENHELKIKNKLLKDFLKNDTIKQKLGLENYIFMPEPSVIDNDYNDFGYIDIAVISKKTSFIKENSEFIFECKRLDGGLDLNRKYLTEGIIRFVNEKYCSTHGINGMLGFLVKDMNIEENIIKINEIQNSENIKINFIQKIKKLDFEFEYGYLSRHKSISKKDFEITHLMLDYSSFFNN